MALTNMKVFNEALQTTTIETLGQMVDKFNAASRGSIILTTEGFQGDFRLENQWQGLHAAQRRVDRYAANNAAAATPLVQIQEAGVKVAGGFGPTLWEPGQMAWVNKSPEEAVEVISRNLAEAILQDQLNTIIAALIAAIEARGTLTTFDQGAGPITYTGMNQAHAKFGDRSGAIIANVMDGVSYHGLIGQNITNANNLFKSDGVTIVDILGRPTIVTDAPALRESGVDADAKALGLVAGAGVVYDGSELIVNVQTTNGKERIETTMQADYDFGITVKGYGWNVGTGGKSPTDAEISTGANWDKIATSVKHTAGVLVLADI